MSQASISLANTSGSLFRANLNNALAAISSIQSGSTRPTGLTAPFLWLCNTVPSATTWTLYICDGTDDLALCTINTTTNAVTPNIPAASVTNAMLASGVGVLANNLVALNASAALPAVSGVNLTNVNAAQLGGKTVGTAANNIVALDAGAALPAVSGVNLTNVNAAQLGGKAVGTAANNIVALNGSGQLPAVSGALLTGIVQGGFTLLGTLATTSGAQATLSGLTLTSYRYLYLVVNSVTAQYSSIYLDSGRVATFGYTGSLSGTALIGFGQIDLSSGHYFSHIDYNTQVIDAELSNDAAGTTYPFNFYIGKCGYTNASTSITVYNTTVGSGFSGGSISIYGVK